MLRGQAFAHKLTAVLFRGGVSTIGWQLEHEEQVARCTTSGFSELEFVDPLTVFIGWRLSDHKFSSDNLDLNHKLPRHSIPLAPPSCTHHSTGFRKSHSDFVKTLTLNHLVSDDNPENWVCRCEPFFKGVINLVSLQSCCPCRTYAPKCNPHRVIEATRY